MEFSKNNNLPMLDELVESLKILSTSCILKNEEEADKYETLDIKKKSDRYIMCIQKRVRFESFKYTRQDYIKAGVDELLLDEYIRNNNMIPAYIKEIMKENARKKYIENYVEENKYYRTLNGIPNLGEPDIYIPKDLVPNNILDIVDISKPIHLIKKADIDLLYNLGVVDYIIKSHPEYKYLKHLGSKRVDIYTARVAPNFYLLYCDTNCPREILVRFKQRIEINRVYTLKVIYNDAFKLNSDYYDNFIGVFIVVQTILDLIASLPEMIINKEFFDIRTIEIVFKSHGIDFFPEIPFKYQLAMVKNINRLIKYKATTKNIVDICSLFGFDNIQVFKYYLLKDRKVDKATGNFIFNYKEEKNPKTGEIEKVPDELNNYELKFIKVPIEDNPDDYIHDETKLIDYDDITLGDKYWDGDLPHEMVRQQILSREFNYLQSKYLSVDTIYSMTELSFDSIYFYNMLFDDVILEDRLTIPIPSITTTGEFRFVDVICYLYALMYLYNELEDDLMDTPTKVMYIKGFNFDANMTDLATYIRRKGFTMKELGIDDFQIPDDHILTYEQLMTIFTKNKKVFDHVCKQMREADNYNIYKVYKTIYDSLMINEFNMEFFRKKNGKVAKTYTDFLKDRNIILYDSLNKIRDVKSIDVRREKINNLVNDIIYIIEEYVELEDFKFIFSAFPSVSAEGVKQYIYKVINFFKSYKVDINSINTIYKFDDKLENKILVLDRAIFKYIFTRQETIEALSKVYNTSKLNYKDRISLIEDISIKISYWIDLIFRLNVNITDENIELFVKTLLGDYSNVDDKPQYIISLLKQMDKIPFKDFINKKVRSLPTEQIAVMEKIYIILSRCVDKLFKQELQLLDKIGMILAHTSMYEDLCPYDSKYTISKLSEKDKVVLYDKITSKYSAERFETIDLTEAIFFYRTFKITLQEEKYELYAGTEPTITTMYKDHVSITDNLIINS